MWTKHIAFIVLCFVALGLLVEGLKPTRPDTSSQPASAAPPTDGLVVTLARLNRAFEAEWAQHGITPAPRASDLTLMRRLSLAPAQCWMIGDRHMDIDGARHHGMRNIGVLWGFGGEAELRGAGADRLAAAPAELHALLA